MKTGSLFKASGMLVGVVACNCSAVTAVIGVGDSVMSEMTREPVTVTASTLLRFLGVGAGRQGDNAGGAHKRELVHLAIAHGVPLESLCVWLATSYWRLAALPTEK